MLRAYSSSKRERRAATWLRPGPPRPSRQSEEEEGDREPLLLLEAGDISWDKRRTHDNFSKRLVKADEKSFFIPQHCTNIPPGWKPLQRIQACPKIRHKASVTLKKKQHLNRCVLHNPPVPFRTFIFPLSRKAKVDSAFKILHQSASQCTKI